MSAKNLKLADLIRRIKSHGPTRVIVHKSGEAVSAWRALSEYFIIPEVVFIRRDGWSLGAPAQFVEQARWLWQDEWIHEFEL